MELAESEEEVTSLQKVPPEAEPESAVPLVATKTRITNAIRVVFGQEPKHSTPSLDLVLK